MEHCIDALMTSPSQSEWRALWSDSRTLCLGLDESLRILFDAVDRLCIPPISA